MLFDFPQSNTVREVGSVPYFIAEVRSHANLHLKIQNLYDIFKGIYTVTNNTRRYTHYIKNYMTSTLHTTVVGTIFSLFAILAFAFPAFTHAGEYAYVNNLGYVEKISANSADEALQNATNLNIHSGVCLLTTQSDFSMVGVFVKGAVILASAK